MSLPLEAMRHDRLPDSDGVMTDTCQTIGSSIRTRTSQAQPEDPEHGKGPKAHGPVHAFACIRHPLDRNISARKMFTQAILNPHYSSAPADARPLKQRQFPHITVDNSTLFHKRWSHFKGNTYHHLSPQTHPFYRHDETDSTGQIKALEPEVTLAANLVALQPEPPQQRPLRASVLASFANDFLELGH
jgi:hypothetical protein